MIFLFILAIYLPIDSWQNEVLEELQVRGEYVTRFPSIRPYDIGDAKINGNTSLRKRIWLPNLSMDARYDTVKVVRVKPTLFYESPAFTVFMQPVVKFGEDSLPPSNQFMDLFSSDYERAYIRYHTKNVNAFIGRERFVLGPSPRYNLLLSGYSAPMDWFHFSFSTEVLKFSYYLSRLDDMYTKPLEYVGDTITEYIQASRYLSIRRLDFSPTEWLNVSFSEAATFGGEHYALSVYHFNPVILLHTYQYNWDEDANLFFHIDARVFLKNLSFYAALLVDDFQLEEDANNEPHHLGFNCGIEFADFLNFQKTFWIIEYTALTRYMYTHFVPYQRYYYVNTPIGSHYGPDYDELYTKFIYHIRPKVDLYAEGSYARKGETTIANPWPIPERPRQQGTFFPADNFLSGIIQTSFDVGIGVRFFHRQLLCSDIFIGYCHIANFGHEDGTTKNFLSFRIQLGLIHL